MLILAASLRCSSAWSGCASRSRSSCPRPLLMPIVFTLCVIGSYAINGVSSICGHARLRSDRLCMRQYNYPAAPWCWIILGTCGRQPAPGADPHGSDSPFFTRPFR